MHTRAQTVSAELEDVGAAAWRASVAMRAHTAALGKMLSPSPDADRVCDEIAATAGVAMLAREKLQRCLPLCGKAYEAYDSAVKEARVEAMGESV